MVVGQTRGPFTGPLLAPVYPARPATTKISPFNEPLVYSFLICWFMRSAMYKLPSVSSAGPLGPYKRSEFAGVHWLPFGVAEHSGGVLSPTANSVGTPATVIMIA